MILLPTEDLGNSGALLAEMVKDLFPLVRMQKYLSKLILIRIENGVFAPKIPTILIGDLIF